MKRAQRNMKIHRHSIQSIALCLLLLVTTFSCKDGKDGDPGPQGMTGNTGAQGQPGPDGQPSIFSRGYFKGTIEGMRQDGNAFSETFDYTYTSDTLEAFSNVLGTEEITVQRYSSAHDDRFLAMKLQWQDGTLKLKRNYPPMQMTFGSELDNQTVFVLRCFAYLDDTDPVYREISYLDNKIYSFATNNEGSVVYYPTTFQATAVFQLYISGYRIYYDQSDGHLIGLQDYSGNTFTDGDTFDKFNRLKFEFNGSSGKYEFIDVASGNSLAENVPATPGDVVTFSNVKLDPDTGILSFDFEAHIGGIISNILRQNTTGHDLLIKGSFNSGQRIYFIE